MSHRPTLSRRQFNAALAALAATPLMVEQARAASSLVAATFPNAWEDAYRRVIAPLLAAQGTELVVAPALAQDQLAKTLASPGKPPYDALLMSPGQTADSDRQGPDPEDRPEKQRNWDKLSPSAAASRGPNVTVEVNGIAYNPTKCPSPPATRTCSRTRPTTARSHGSVSAPTPRRWPGSRSRACTAAAKTNMRRCSRCSPSTCRRSAPSPAAQAASR